MDFEDHSKILEALKKSQEADHDNREAARESQLFITKRDGQWEPYWWNANQGKPRYTFDLVSPIIDQVAGSLEKQDFEIRVLPQGGDASKDAAKVYDGLVRNIESISGADDIYARSGRSMVVKGLDGWRVSQKYVEGDSFDQDLVIEKIPNFLDHVWFGPHKEPDASDAQFCWVLAGVTPEDFKEKYPERSESASVESDRKGNAYYHRHDLVMLGEFLYLKEESRELVLMSNSKVYEVNDEFKSVADDLAKLGITEMRRRTRKVKCQYSRRFDANGWLDEKPRKTVFRNWLSVVPCYANFEYVEDKPVYFGAVEKLIDPQRVFNYTLSRETEEGALAPRAKYWLTEKQAQGHGDTLATLNTNADPVQFYNPDTEAPGPPQQQGGAQVNPGLVNIRQAMQDIVGMSAGMFAANMGDNPGLQSGKAIEALQDRGDQGSNKYVEARRRAQRHTGRILVDAIPRVYTPGRQVRLLQPDGSFEMKAVGEMVQDAQTGQTVVLNDLSEGIYDVSCEAGPAFQNRQSETVRALTEIGRVDPSVIEIGGDVMLGNINAPGMDQVAERKRQQLFQAGAIPFEQMTEQEKQLYQQMMQQPPQESPEMVLAKAEEAKAQADLIAQQTKQAELQGKMQIEQANLQIRQAELSLKQTELEIEKVRAGAEVKAKGAQAAKHLEEARAQDIENDAVESGVKALLERSSG